LKQRPKNFRYSGWWIVCRVLSIHRDPIATSAPSLIAASSSSASSIGADRSASVNITTSPSACSRPLRTE
jgi:hypothetical protein